MSRVEVPIGGMHCASCVRAVEGALHSVLAPHATPEGVRMESASWMVRARI